MPQDLRYALRVMLRRPGFTVVAVLILALGLGANTAVFSVVEGLLLRPLPFPEPDRLVMVWERNLVRGRDRNVVHPANFLAWEERARSFESLGAFSAWSANLTGRGEPARLEMGAVTPSLFTTLGVRPLAGRLFDDADAAPGAPEVVLLSERFWKRLFGGDLAALGRTLVLNGRPRTIVGVLPPEAQVPPEAEFWVPFTLDEQFRTFGGRFLSVVARLRPGVSVEEARAEMDLVASGLAEEVPDRDAGWGVSVYPLYADLVRHVRPAVLMLGGAVAFVLLIACGNLANLLLARALGREREIAIRQAMGASRWRLVRQLVTESLVLAILGGASGLLLAQWLVQALATLVPQELRTTFPVGLNGRVLAFTAATSVACTLLFGLAPAIQAVRHAVASSLREGAAASGTGRSRRRLGRLLVASEVALSVVLLAGAGLLLRSFLRLSAVDPGFDARTVLSFQVNLPDRGYEEPDRGPRLFRDAVARITALPGVEAAAAMSWGPFLGGSATRFALPDRPAPAPGQEPVADVRMVTAGLFRTLGVPIRRGRDFTDADDAAHPGVVIVNERLARQHWPGEDPLGKTVRMAWDRTLEAEVVGVVGDVRLASLDVEPRATLYWPQLQVPNDFMTFLVRSGRAREDLLPALKGQMAALDPDLPVARATSLEDLVGGSLDRPRATLALTAAFAATAAILAALGLFGVLSYSVAQRVPEMGVRLALGARPGDVLGLVLREALALAAAGAAVGIAGALALGRSLEALLYGVSPRDPLAYLAAAAIALFCGGLAGAVPARRASRVEPAAALRAE
ncbi:MAG: ABC transporter permease [Acidobacteria bacterium]|nr:ABC transporter permease [Acidobacteriota bacterium]